MEMKYPRDGHYLIYVTKFDMSANEHRSMIVYEYTGDPFHAMGEIDYRTLEQIYRMTFSEDTPQKREYWKTKVLKLYLGLISIKVYYRRIVSDS